MVMALRIRTNALQRAARVALPAMVLSAGFGAGASANVLVSSGATTNITCTSGVCTPTKGGAVLNASQLVDMLASGNVKITTDGAKASNIMING
jgi:ABC-type molybdate transport system ATPase subunit